MRDDDDDDDDDDLDTTLFYSTYFEENAGAEFLEHSARIDCVFNPVARILNFDEDSDTTDEGAVGQVVVAIDVHMGELQQPESPALVDWQRFGPADKSRRKRSERHESPLIIASKSLCGKTLRRTPALYHQIAHNPEARIQCWFRDQAANETSPLYIDADLTDLIARMLESFASYAEP